jgi:hypothetical protein
MRKRERDVSGKASSIKVGEVLVDQHFPFCSNLSARFRAAFFQRQDQISVGWLVTKRRLDHEGNKNQLRSIGDFPSKHLVRQWICVAISLLELVKKGSQLLHAYKCINIGQEDPINDKREIVE